MINTNYQESALRALPVVLLLDTSGSMRRQLGTATKIDKLNEAVKVMMNEFAEQEQYESFIRVTVITFDDKAQIVGKINDEPKNFLDNFTPLTGGGLTNLGEALDEAKRILEDSTLTPKRWYIPAVILVTDGKPEPEGNADIPLEKFVTEGKTAGAQRFAIPIGAEGQKAQNLLLKFTGTDKNLFPAENAQDIVERFRYLSQKITERVSQKNPDNISIIDIDGIFDDAPATFRTRNLSAPFGRSRKVTSAQPKPKDPWDF